MQTQQNTQVTQTQLLAVKQMLLAEELFALACANCEDISDVLEDADDIDVNALRAEAVLQAQQLLDNCK